MMVFEVKAVVSRPTPLIGWSGSFIAKLIKSSMPRDVLSYGFSVSPLLQDGELVLSGVDGRSAVLEAGSRIAFRFTSFCRDNSVAPSIVEAFSGDSFGVFKVLEVEFKVFESSMDLLKDCNWCGEDRLVKLIDSRSRGLVEILFGPTTLMFRGWRILYPSPQRLVYTLAKSGVNLLDVDPKIAKRRARALSRNIEVVGFGTKPVEVFIGRGRRAKAFMGRAVFGVQGLENLRDFVELLELGKLVGVGRSKGIGFGYIDYKVVPPPPARARP